MNSLEHEEMRRQITELVEKGFVRENMTHFAMPTLLSLKKRGKTWRLCMDSRSINNIMMKYYYPLPMMDDFLDCLSGSRIFSKNGPQMRLPLNQNWRGG